MVKTLPKILLLALPLTTLAHTPETNIPGLISCGPEDKVLDHLVEEHGQTPAFSFFSKHGKLKTTIHMSRDGEITVTSRHSIVKENLCFVILGTDGKVLPHTPVDPSREHQEIDSSPEPKLYPA